MRVLILEDDFRLRQAYSRRLRADGHAVDEAGTLRHARASCETTRYDCLVLDRLLPDGDSIDFVRELAADEDRSSILLLSGLRNGAHRVEGLTTGADDYLEKPVSLEELVLRVRKLLVRRSPAAAVVRIGSVSVDRPRRQVCIAGEPVHLSPTQYSVLEQLVIHMGHVVGQGSLLEHCWDAQRDPFSDPLHSQITRLRGIFRGHLVIETARGTGYMLRGEAHRM